MNAITVKKSDLLDILRKNREQHHTIFLEATEGYREAVIKELDSMLKDAKKGRKIRRSVTLTQPVDQTHDYDRVIRMMEMEVWDTVQLKEREFQSYVLDQWSWKKQFTASNVGYSKALADIWGGGEDLGDN